MVSLQRVARRIDSSSSKSVKIELKFRGKKHVGIRNSEYHTFPKRKQKKSQQNLNKTDVTNCSGLDSG